MYYQSNIGFLETCWYLSPPWGSEIPQVKVNIFEKVYMSIASKMEEIGYCCGFECDNGSLRYLVVSNVGILPVMPEEVIPSGKFKKLNIEKPKFKLGQLVEYKFASEISKIRIIQGLLFINNSYFYQVEVRSPQLPYLKFPDEESCVFPKSSKKKLSTTSWAASEDLKGL